MTDNPLSRRSLLKVSLLGGGGLMLAVQLPGLARAAGPVEDQSAAFVPNAFVRIDPGGAITLIMPHTEFGQGVYTSSAMLIGEELEVGLDQIEVRPAPPDLKKYLDPLLYGQATGGSTSTRTDWVRLRQVGAAARIMLTAAAAERWGVQPVACRVGGVIHHDATGQSVTYGAVATDAERQPVPAHIKLKTPEQFTLIGTSARRLDTPAKVNGTAVFGIDIRLPGMLIGTLAITPVKGGRLIGMNEAAACQVPGVHDIIRAGDEAVAVIGDR
jgi:isoquinoline 1-oxidoreductase beta subunit